MFGSELPLVRYIKIMFIEVLSFDKRSNSNPESQNYKATYMCESFSYVSGQLCVYYKTMFMQGLLSNYISSLSFRFILSQLWFTGAE